MTEPLSYVTGTFFFGTPYSRVGASVGYIKSLIAFAEESRKPMSPHMVGSLIAPGTSYGQQRNAIVYAAMEAKAEWILMIDDDITFPATIARSLASTGTGIALGAVPISQTEMNVWRGTDDGRVMPELSVMPNGEPTQEVTAYGCAVAMIHMSVIAMMGVTDGWGSWFNCHTIKQAHADGKVETQLEPDLSFAWRARVLGAKAVARFDLGLTHSKPVELRYDISSEKK